MPPTASKERTSSVVRAWYAGSLRGMLVSLGISRAKASSQPQATLLALDEYLLWDVGDGALCAQPHMLVLLTLEPFLGDADLIEPGLYIYEPANHDLTYEKMYELNWSVDFGLWDRINASVTLFSREGRDLIDIVRPQGTGGFVNDVYGNAAAMTAKGAEVSLTTQNIHTKNFSWSTTLTYSHSTNKVTKLNTRPDVTALTSSSGAARLGYPLGSIFSIPFYKLDGDGFPHFFYPMVERRSLMVVASLRSRVVVRSRGLLPMMIRSAICFTQGRPDQLTSVG